jgi:hypothetical protein
LDYEEIESMAKAVDYMIDLSEKWKAENKEYSEVIFHTKGNLKIGFFQRISQTFCASDCFCICRLYK